VGTCHHMVTQPLWFTVAQAYTADVGDQFGCLTWTEREVRCQELQRVRKRKTSED
jgi:hypothetical protein